MSHYDETKNRFNPENRFIGDIEDGKRYPFACYTKEESDERYAPISTSTDLTALTAVVATKANQSDLTALSGVVDTKAAASDLTTLSGVVDTKAAQSDLTALSDTVSGKASQTDLATLSGTVSDLTTTVNGKASQSDLSALSDTVATKASSSDLSALSDTVATKASSSDLNSLANTVSTKANTSDVNSLAAVVNTKANQSDLTATNSIVATKANQTTVDSLVNSVSAKANQSTVDALSATVSASGETVEALDSRMSTAESNIAIQTARIDNLSTLTEGSTTGDAELMDIRVKADGSTSASAGDAVREQIEEVNGYIFNDTTLMQYSDKTFSESLGDGLWASDYIYNPGYIESIILEKTETSGDDNEILLYILDENKTVLDKLFFTDGTTSPVLAINKYISVPFMIGIRCKKLKYAPITDSGSYIYTSYSDTNSYQLGDTFSWYSTSATYPLSIGVKYKSLVKDNDNTNAVINTDLFTGTVKKGINNSFQYLSVGESVWVTNIKYKRGYVDSITLNFTNEAAQDVVMLMILDSNFKILKKVLDSNQTAGEGYRTFKVNYYVDGEFYIALRAPGAAYQSDARSYVKDKIWSGAWGTYGYYKEGDTLPITFDSDTNIKFDIAVNYDYIGGERKLHNNKRIYSLYDAFRSWEFGEKFPIGIIGDSTTDGDLTSDPSHNVLGTDYINTYAYPYLLEQNIKDATNNNLLRVYNFGFSGKNAEWVLKNFDEMVWNNTYCNDVKMLIISHGINDYAFIENNNYWYEVCLRQIVLSCFAHGVQPVIMTTQAGMEHYQRYSDKQMSISDGINHRIAEEFNLELIDKNKFTAMFNTYSSATIDAIIPDGCHYGDYGHKYEAGMIFAHIIPYTIWCGEENQLIGLENEKIRTQFQYRGADSNWIEVKKITPVNGFKLEAQSTAATDRKIMECYVFISGTKQKQVKTFCRTATSQRIVIDGVTTNITETEQTIATLDLGLHKITVYSGTGSNVNFYGVKLIDA